MIAPRNQEVYEKIASDLESMKDRLEDAKDLRDALKEVQQDTTTLDTQISDLSRAIERWTRMLTARGYMSKVE